MQRVRERSLCFNALMLLTNIRPFVSARVAIECHRESNSIDIRGKFRIGLPSNLLVPLVKSAFTLGLPPSKFGWRANKYQPGYTCPPGFSLLADNVGTCIASRPR